MTDGNIEKNKPPKMLFTELALEKNPGLGIDISHLQKDGGCFAKSRKVNNEKPEKLKNSTNQKNSLKVTRVD